MVCANVLSIRCNHFTPSHNHTCSTRTHARTHARRLVRRYAHTHTQLIRDLVSSSQGAKQPKVLRTLRPKQRAIQQELKEPFSTLQQLRSAIYKMLFSMGEGDLQLIDDRVLLVKLDEIIDTLAAFSMVCSHSGH